VAETLADEIREGRLAVGDRLPAEAELVARFRVSRATVRQAVGRLVELGLVRTHQGARTEVVATEPWSRYVMSARSLEDIVRYARTTFLEVRERRFVEVGARRSERLGFPLGRRLLYLRGVRREGRSERPIGVTEVFLDARFAAALDAPHRVESAIFAAIEQRFGVVVNEVVQEFSAEALGRHAGFALGVPPGSPALRIVRRYFAGTDLVEVAVNLHPARAFAYETRFLLERHGLGRGRPQPRPERSR
jgi:GntR family transcriptional regulator